MNINGRYRAAILSLALLLLLISPVIYARLPSTTDLAGQWRVKDGNPPATEAWSDTLDDDSWQRLKVPANWYSEGIDHQGILWYRTRFTLPVLDTDNMATLIFDGVDYQTEVWLNNQKVGQHKGYFQRFSIDITDAAQRENVLAMRVDSPDETPGKVWSFHKQLIKGVLNHHDTRPGGAWSAHGQDANSGGIWAPVASHISRGAVIDNLLAVPDWSEGLEHPILKVSVDYRANRNRSVIMRLRLIPDNFIGQSYQLEKSVSLVASQHNAQTLTTNFLIDNPALWWPSGHGKQNLYRLEVSFSDRLGIMDTSHVRTGLRQIAIDSREKSWSINGKRLFIRGTNYIGSPWLGTLAPADYRRDLVMMMQANINAIRVHAHVAGRALYDLADEMGILLWQDFPLQWGYDNSATFAREAARQAADMTRQFGSHPSIIVWSGHNEPPWDATWMQYRYSDWRPGINRVLTASVAQVLAQDNSRITHAYSATGEHYWQGWYSGQKSDHLKPATTSIISEFGAQALPDLPTLKTIIPTAELWPKTTDKKDQGWRIWAYHNFQPHETFELAKITRGPNINTFITHSQQYQASLIQLAAESYRRQRYQPVAALFHFMFTETWPSINWGIVDYLRHPKPGYFALQRAYQPILPSIEPKTEHWIANQIGRIGLWAINDNWQDYPQASLHWRITQNGMVLSAGMQPINLMADSGQKVIELQVIPRSFHEINVTSDIINKQEEILGHNEMQLQVQP
ncbi:glycoside hydrolase family 2 protein [Yersinia ruckeri]|uniref:glycoside hydrolase family 2 protein n=1 Tax=Yersinia ruckeri TaxID=29486 RepID=UPI001F3CEDC0|nr:sugar-binding domain-containing protein [Yersinia ruckeri]MCK8537651.1 beta galactosidase jelly roll domain-containing protein [Yersinia ruckeri]MCK8571273.1 beta galactosidase jelly roll domain-containing protein [Yersinia ruckeri]MCK8573491.1 beta galactosidase jelly roll domain-containing protein [Yersinia ruckeri]MCK8577724.1 beta galactosidase jelly roll domain-containing protein [Yersinia ruckeri]MCK8581401.1 beta galactosidase jelly roll domain-containing protein [Yersinia ruckeri]